jgi:hypothetical protein
MAKGVSRQPLTSEAWVHAWNSHCGICGGQSGTKTCFLQLLWFSTANTIPL